MAESLVCWKCGAALAGVPLPLSRQAECPACRAWLHACRLCRYYDPRIEGKCAEDRAEEVRDKEGANFCDWFKPRPDAFAARASEKSEAAKSKIDALFGGDNDAAAAVPDGVRGKLDELFGGKSGK
jgi:hypothetical protein